MEKAKVYTEEFVKCPNWSCGVIIPMKELQGEIQAGAMIGRCPKCKTEFVVERR